MTYTERNTKSVGDRRNKNFAKNNKQNREITRNYEKPLDQKRNEHIESMTENKPVRIGIGCPKKR